MKKYVFIISIFACGILFFISGSLVGFFVYDKQIQETESNNNKPKRKPSAERRTSPLIGKIVDRKTAALKQKLRMPSVPAIEKAKTYKSEV